MDAFTKHTLQQLGVDIEEEFEEWCNDYDDGYDSYEEDEMTETPIQAAKIERETTIVAIGDSQLFPEPITIPANSYLAIAYTKDWKPKAVGIYNEQGELQRTISL